MAQIFKDDFEDGTLNAWNQSGTPTIESTSPKEGTYYVRLYNTSTYSYDVINVTTGIADKPEYYLVGYWKIRGVSGEYWDSFFHVYTSGAGGVDAGISPTSANQSSVTIGLYTGGTLRGSTSATKSVDVWDGFQLRVKPAGASSVAELKMFGETITDTTNFNDGNAVEISIWGGCHNYGNRGDEYDYIVVDDAAYPDLLGTDDFFTLLQGRRELYHARR